MTNHTARLLPEVAAFLERPGAFGPMGLSSLSVADAREASSRDLREAELIVDPSTYSWHDVLLPLEGRDLLARVYRPSRHGSDPLPVLLWFHGGGFVLRGLESADGLCAKLSVGADCLVVAVDYRLAPEHPWPSGHLDAIDSLVWIKQAAKELGGDSNRLAVGGDSAGGHIAAMTAQGARRVPDLDLVAQVLFYPVVSTEMNAPSYREFADGYGLTAEDMTWFFNHTGVGSTHEATAFSLFDAGDLSGLAPAIIATAECDVLRDEAEEYAAALTRAGCRVTASRYLGMPHGFAQMTAVTPVAGAAIAAMASSLRMTWTTRGSQSSPPGLAH